MNRRDLLRGVLLAPFARLLPKPVATPVSVVANEFRYAPIVGGSYVPGKEFFVTKEFVTLFNGDGPFTTDPLLKYVRDHGTRNTEKSNG